MRDGTVSEIEQSPSQEPNIFYLMKGNPDNSGSRMKTLRDTWLSDSRARERLLIVSDKPSKSPLAAEAGEGCLPGHEGHPNGLTCKVATGLRQGGLL